jgi:metal-dependent amidase/aminoacylase/carboxypeptidase family protein
MIWGGLSDLPHLALHGPPEGSPAVRIAETGGAIRITQGGEVPNIVPAYAQLWCWVRDSRRDGVEDVLARLRKVAEGAGLMAEVESKLTVQCGVPEMLVIHTAKVLAATADDLFAAGAMRQAIRAEFREKTRGSDYRPLIPEGPPARPGP